MNKGVSLFKPLAGIYVLWQGSSLLIDLKDGDGPFGFGGSLALGLFFVAFGVWCIVSYYREYRAYKQEQEEEAKAAEETKMSAKEAREQMIARLGEDDADVVEAEAKIVDQDAQEVIETDEG